MEGPVEIVWIALRMGGAVVWRVGLGAVIGLVLGAILLALALRILNLPWIRVPTESTQKLLCGFALVGWILLVLPGTALSGAGMGSAFGARHIMEEAAIVDKAGTLAFTALFASLASATDEPDPAVQRPHYEKTKAYMEGELTIRIDTWTDRVMALPEKANEEAATWSTENVHDDADDEGIGQIAAEMSAWLVQWFLKRELRERREYLEAIAVEAESRDARRDNDGFATSRELALAAAPSMCTSARASRSGSSAVSFGIRFGEVHRHWPYPLRSPFCCVGGAVEKRSCRSAEAL
jgi:hypothetical protein